MPLYGQSFTLADSSNYALNEPSYGPGEAGEFTRAGGFLAFYEVNQLVKYILGLQTRVDWFQICERVKSKSWTVKRDPLGRIGPYAHMGSQWVSYDDIAEIRRKVMSQLTSWKLLEEMWIFSHNSWRHWGLEAAWFGLWIWTISETDAAVENIHSSRP